MAPARTRAEPPVRIPSSRCTRTLATSPTACGGRSQRGLRDLGMVRQPRLREVTFQRGIDGSEPVRARPISARPGAHEDRQTSRSWRLATGTLACPRCDAPVVLGGRAVSPAADLDCPFCRHTAPLRDFLAGGALAARARGGARAAARSRRAPLSHAAVRACDHGDGHEPARRDVPVPLAPRSADAAASVSA